MVSGIRNTSFTLKVGKKEYKKASLATARLYRVVVKFKKAIFNIMLAKMDYWIVGLFYSVTRLIQSWGSGVCVFISVNSLISIQYLFLCLFSSDTSPKISYKLYAHIFLNFKTINYFCSEKSLKNTWYEKD